MPRETPSRRVIEDQRMNEHCLECGQVITRPELAYAITCPLCVEECCPECGQFIRDPQDVREVVCPVCLVDRYALRPENSAARLPHDEVVPDAIREDVARYQESNDEQPLDSHSPSPKGQGSALLPSIARNVVIDVYGIRTRGLHRVFFSVATVVALIGTVDALRNPNWSHLFENIFASIVCGILFGAFLTYLFGCLYPFVSDETEGIEVIRRRVQEARRRGRRSGKEESLVGEGGLASDALAPPNEKSLTNEQITPALPLRSDSQSTEYQP
jgi:hypothetical protein